MENFMEEIASVNELVDSGGWKNFVMPWGKHKGWTMFQIYVNDYSYISEFLIMKCKDPDVLRMAGAAVEHKNRIDPFST